MLAFKIFYERSEQGKMVRKMGLTERFSDRVPKINHDGIMGSITTVSKDLEILVYVQDKASNERGIHPLP